VKKGLVESRVAGSEYHSEEEFLPRLRDEPVTVSGGLGPWPRKRANRLMFCAAAARKNCSRTKVNLRRAPATKSHRSHASAPNASSLLPHDPIETAPRT